MEPRRGGPRLMSVIRSLWVLALTLLAACGTVSGESHSVSLQSAGQCDSAAVAQGLNEAIGSTLRPHKNLAEFLPNVRHAWQDSPEHGEAVTDSVVLGRVTDVVRDRGFIEKTQPGTMGRPGATETAYDDSAADWRTMRLTVAVDEVLAGPSIESLTVDVPLLGDTTTGGDDSHFECAFTELGAVAVFTKGNPDAPEFLGIPRQFPDKPFGVATVDTTGSLHFPFAPGGPGRTSEAFVADLDTIDELRSELDKPTRTVMHNG